MADVVEINCVDQLEGYRLVWNALLPQTPRASFFHTLDWLQAFWRRFGHERELRVLVVRSEGKPIGIVPLCVQTERYQVGNVRVLTYPLSDWGTWYGPIGPNVTASLFMAIKHLQATPRNWDMLDLRWMGSCPGSSDVALGASRAGGWQVSQSDYQRTSIIDLPGTDWETYRAQLSKKWRHELGRQQRGLHRNFHVEFKRHRPAGASYGDADPRWDLYESCLAIAEKSWQGSSKTGNTLSHANVRAFLRDGHDVAARLGMLDVAVLRLDGQPAAFQYNYVYDGNVLGLRMGYDPKCAKHGVGKALTGWIIEDSFQRGDQTIDMGAGDYPYKREFRTRTETSRRLTYFPWATLRGQGVRATRWLKSRWPA